MLGGGGSAGVGWESGLLHGLAESGIDVLSAGLIVGTSAGAVVGVRARCAGDSAQLYEQAMVPTGPPVDLDFDRLTHRWAQTVDGAETAADGRRRLAVFAAGNSLVDARRRRAEIAAMLPTPTWPAAPLVVAAVNGTTGRHTGFAVGSGVDLVDAVAASCAVPGVWPPVTIDGDPYVDGAVRSALNADLAAGGDPVLALAPLPDPSGRLERELSRLPAGTRHLLMTADGPSAEAFGSNPLDPSVGPAAARAGHRQGRAMADVVRDLLAAASGLPPAAGRPVTGRPG